ncbi:hypothetical protein GTO27_11450, partial [Candidatus Bathyarchaeota archaeon]|nr:hypothetical protein [Candidatus Bathyarchaeota archaeon]
MKAREGDLIEIKTGPIFDVKGLVHPPSRIIAFPRFIPDTSGDRKNKYSAYRKVYSLPERFEFLEQQFPHYVVNDCIFDEKLCEVPMDAVKRHYEPTEILQGLRSSSDLDSLQDMAVRLAKAVKETADIPWEAIGISGSIMVGLHKSDSDLDPIVYGSENCQKVHT